MHSAGRRVRIFFCEKYCCSTFCSLIDLRRGPLRRGKKELLGLEWIPVPRDVRLYDICIILNPELFILYA